MEEKVRERQAQFELREWTLGQVLDHTVARFPDNEALVYPDRNYRQTWSEFGALVDDFAKGLMALGVQKGEKVAVWATNVPVLGGIAIRHGKNRRHTYYGKHQLP